MYGVQGTVVKFSECPKQLQPGKHLIVQMRHWFLEGRGRDRERDVNKTQR